MTGLLEFQVTKCFGETLTTRKLKLVIDKLGLKPWLFLLFLLSQELNKCSEKETKCRSCKRRKYEDKENPNFSLSFELVSTNYSFLFFPDLYVWLRGHIFWGQRTNWRVLPCLLSNLRQGLSVIHILGFSHLFLLPILLDHTCKARRHWGLLKQTQPYMYSPRLLTGRGRWTSDTSDLAGPHTAEDRPSLLNIIRNCWTPSPGTSTLPWECMDRVTDFHTTDYWVIGYKDWQQDF